MRVFPAARRRSVFAPFVGALSFLVALLTASQLRAQQLPPAIDQSEEEERREALEKEREATLEEKWTQDLTFKWGGWLRTSTFWFETEPEATGMESDKFHTLDFDVRLWADVRWKETHALFLRTKTRYLTWLTDNAFDEGADHTWDPKIDIDQAYHSVDVDRLFDWGADLQLRLMIGRQYTTLGSGLVYNQVHDGLSARFQLGPVAAKGFYMRSKFDDPNIDISIPGREHSKRYFGGVEVSYRGFSNHTPYAFFLDQKDRSPERPESGLSDFRIDTLYVGVGAHGEVLEGLTYRLEYIWEDGRSCADPFRGDSSREDIDGHTLLCELNYHFLDTYGEPAVGASYYQASGDHDRRLATSTLNGNLTGTVDGAFYPFGYTFLGYSLRPALTNLRAFRFEASGNPLETFEDTFKHFRLGAFFFNFWKEEKAGAISDFRATDARSEVGQEVGVYFNWRVLSDVSLQGRYAHFFPGAAYDHHTGKDFYSLSFTLSF